MTKHHISVGFAVLLVVALALSTSVVLADAFTERVRNAIAKEAPGLRPTIRADDEIGLAVGDGEALVFLENIRSVCADRSADCDAEILAFVRGITAAIRDESSIAISSTNVFPVLRAEEILQSTGQISGKDAKSQMTSRSFVNGSVIVYVIDTPDAFHFVSLEDLDDTGLSLDRLHGLALENAGRLMRLEIEPLQGASGIFVAIANDGLGTSRVLDPVFWRTLERVAGGATAIATPTRDWILAARLDDPAALSRLRVIAWRVFNGEPYSVSPTLFRRDGGGFREVRP